MNAGTVVIELVGGPLDGERMNVQKGTHVVSVAGPCTGQHAYEIYADGRAEHRGPSAEYFAGRGEGECL